ncbi:MAG: hypothetical protein WAM82_35690 [Thermoanaerobaculia bacterium]
MEVELTSDLEQILRRAASVPASGVNAICFLALSDNGAPGYDARNGIVTSRAEG